MEPASHPDPFQDALSHGLHRALQVASSVVTGVQVYVYLKRTQARAVAERDERARRALAAQIRADRDAARSGWAPALDPGWLRRADLYQAAQAWGTAMPYADRATPWYEPAAATAMRKCEERLRILHPYAMARYDRLRAEGMGPADAMREAAPLFSQPAHTRDGQYADRSMLDAGNGETLTWTATTPTPGPGGPGDLSPDQAQEHRGRQVVAALQARARAHGRDPLGEAEQRTVLETVTNLPDDVIDRIVQPAAPGAEPARTARPARPWEHDFPVPVQDVVASAAAGTQEPAQPAATQPAAARRPARHPQLRP
ncbi:MAG: hypothetical protein ACRDPY_04260 [Streptosporangiaceae bacterium]